jgi:hypothetical protein
MPNAGQIDELGIYGEMIPVVLLFSPVIRRSRDPM